MKFTIFTIILGIGFLYLHPTAAEAQKRQKDIHEDSFLVSSPIKVDGRLNDWQDTLQAFNRTALLGYTIANDGKNIYLAIKSPDAANSSKILAGGITFTVNPDGKKKLTEGMSISFPVIKAGQRTVQRPFARGGQMLRTGSAVDSLLIERGKSQLAQAREIKVSGFREIQDSLISIYNEYGVKVAAKYDAQGSLIFEVALPLKLVQINPGNEFAYNIKINGRTFGSRGYSSSQGGSPAARVGRERSGNGGIEERFQGVGSFSEAIDFWGKYSLAVQ